MKPLKTSVGLTLDKDVVEKIKSLAVKQNRSFSQYINGVVMSHIAKIESKAAKEQE